MRSFLISLVSLLLWAVPIKANIKIGDLKPSYYLSSSYKLGAREVYVIPTGSDDGPVYNVSVHLSSKTFSKVLIDGREVMSFDTEVSECEINLGTYVSGYPNDEVAVLLQLEGLYTHEACFVTDHITSKYGTRFIVLNEPWEAIVIGAEPGEEIVRIPEEYWTTEEYSVETFRINGNAFEDANDMKELYIPGNVIDINYDAFGRCPNLEKVEISDSDRPLYLRNTGLGGILSQTPVKSVHLGRPFTCLSGNGWTSPIEGCANLEEVTFGPSEIILEEAMFMGCSNLKSIELPPNLIFPEKYYARDSDSGTIPTRSESSGMFKKCQSLESVIINSPINSTGYSMFEQCRNLKYVKLPETVTKIGAYTFLCCDSLTDIPELPNLQYIGSESFSGCTSFTDLVIPETVNTIGYRAFKYCTSLSNITIPGSVTSIGSQILDDAGPIKNVYYTADEIREFDRKTFGDFNGISNATLYVKPNLVEAAKTTYPWCLINNIVGKYFGITEVESIEFDKTNLELKPGDKTTIAVTILPENATMPTLSWHSSAPDIVSVSEDGAITALSQGEADITATTTDGTQLSAVCHVTVKDPSTFTSGNLTYHIYATDILGINLAEVSAADKSISGKIEIPGAISTNGIQCTVMKIAEEGFQMCRQITSVSLPPTLIEIKRRAFYGCSMKSVEFLDYRYDPISIGEEAFSNCASLTDIQLPQELTDLGKSSFGQCSNLQSITFPSTLRHIGENAFSGCGNLTMVKVDHLEDWLNIEFANFESNPFTAGINNQVDLVVGGWSVRKLEIPSTVSEIGNYAFANYKMLEDVILPEQIKSLGKGCFQYANISQITSLGKTPPALGTDCFAGVDKSIPVNVPYEALDAYKSAPGWNEFTNIYSDDPSTFTLGNLTYHIYATDITGNNLAEVSAADKSISGVIEIPGAISTNGIQCTVMKIAEEGFQACSRITSLSLPPTISEIKRRAFFGCQSLEKVEFQNGVYAPLSIEEEAFNNCTSLGGLYIFGENNLTSIGKGAFGQCSNLYVFNFPATLRYVGENAFSGCSSLQQIMINKLEDWFNIQFANFEANPFSAGAYGKVELYINLQALHKLEIPSSISNVGNYAFAYYQFDDEVILPEHVVSLGEGCFQYARIPKIISLNTTPPTLGEYCFDGVDKSTPVRVPYESVEAYKSAPGWCEFTNISGTESIERFTFDGMVYSALTETTCALIQGKDSDKISVPETVSFYEYTFTVTEIGKEAFKTCNLGSIIIPNSVETIHQDALNSKSLKYILIGDGLKKINPGLFSGASLKQITILASQLPELNIYYEEIDPVSKRKPIDILLNSKETLEKWEKFLSAASHLYNFNYRHIELVDSVDLRLPSTPYGFGERIYESLVWIPIKCSYVIEDPAIAEIWDSFEGATGPWINPLKAGETTITVSTNTGLTASTKIIVKRRPEFIRFEMPSRTLAPGDITQLVPDVYPEDATLINPTWTCADPEIASVDQNGWVKALKPGKTEVTVSANGLSADCVIYVIQPVTGISLSSSKADLNIGDSFVLSATISPEDASNKTVYWSSSDETIATVDENGTVFAVAAGKAVITAMASNRLTASCEVTVNQPATGISLDMESADMNVGQTLMLTATVDPENAYDKTVTWTSSDAGVAIVSNDGTVTAISEGNATITATTVNGLSASCEIFVTQLAEAIFISPESIEANIGQTMQLQATVLPENTSNPAIVWSSSNEDIAMVSSKGLVAIVAEGECEIFAETTDGSNLRAVCHISASSGIESIFADGNKKHDIYTATGILIKKGASLNDYNNLPQGIYIIDNQKIYKKH